MSPLTEPTRIILRNGWQPMDPDAATYITAVESADGQALEEPVKIAIDNFVLGCKADGIWDAIKASCILAGARTLDGALVPLAGPVPTNPGNVFLSGDYNRKIGLKGNGTTKYLNSNYTIPSALQNNVHLSAYLGEPHTPAAAEMYNAAVNLSTLNSSQLFRFTASPTGLYSRLNDVTTNLSGSISGAGLVGSSRIASTGYTTITSKSNNIIVQSSTGVSGFSQFIFARNASGSFDLPTTARLAFYSIGESLDLALLDARVTDLINKFAEVIP